LNPRLRLYCYQILSCFPRVLNAVPVPSQSLSRPVKFERATMELRTGSEETRNSPCSPSHSLFSRSTQSLVHIVIDQRPALSMHDLPNLLVSQFTPSPNMAGFRIERASACPPSRSEPECLGKLAILYAHPAVAWLMTTER